MWRVRCGNHSEVSIDVCCVLGSFVPFNSSLKKNCRKSNYKAVVFQMTTTACDRSVYMCDNYSSRLNAQRKWGEKNSIIEKWPHRNVTPYSSRFVLVVWIAMWLWNLILMRNEAAVSHPRSMSKFVSNLQLRLIGWPVTIRCELCMPFKSFFRAHSKANNCTLEHTVTETFKLGKTTTAKNEDAERGRLK